jgi:hypothetical protein
VSSRRWPALGGTKPYAPTVRAIAEALVRRHAKAERSPDAEPAALRRSRWLEEAAADDVALELAGLSP